MRRVAVISAVFSGHNSGMLSVDYAVNAVVRRLGTAVGVRFYALLPPEDSRAHFPEDPSLRPEYAPLIGNIDAVHESDAIVFAGDFFHARHYHLQDLVPRLLGRGLAKTESEAIDLCHEHMMLATAQPDVLAKAILVGGNVLHNRQSDYLEGEYGTLLRRLVTGARRVFMRDVISAFKVASMQGHPEAPMVGCDCALLLGEEDVVRLPRSEPTSTQEDAPTRRAGVFFSRTRTSMEEAWSVAATICSTLRVSPEWLPWNELPRAASWRRLPVQVLPMGSAPETFWDRRWKLGDLLDAVARCPFIVTDTYHLCVHAWRAGVPAICITQPDDYPGTPFDRSSNRRPQEQSVSEEKKSLFYSMYDARDFLVGLHQWRDPLQRGLILSQLTRAFSSRELADGIVQRVRAHGELVGKALVDELASLLAV